MKKVLSAILVCAGLSSVFSGSVVNRETVNGFSRWSILPNCLKTASDTCGPIDLNKARNFSLTCDFNRLTGKDTAVTDSGVIIKIMQSPTASKLTMVQISTADSVFRPFANDTSRVRSIGRAKGLTLDPLRYAWIIFTRWDTNADTLDFKTAAGVRDSLAMTWTNFSPER